MAGPQFVYVMKGLSKTYPGGKQVLKDIWLSFYPGAKIGIVGVNGAGKSTLMKMLAGAYPIDSGEVRINGQSARIASPADSQASLRWPQHRQRRRRPIPPRTSACWYRSRQPARPM